jgi:hypothetical protein
LSHARDSVQAPNLNGLAMLKSSLEWVPGNPNDRSIGGFRIRNGSGTGPMSRSFYYTLRKRGIGPRETFLAPTKVIITPADELAWQQARSHPHGTEAKLKARAEKMRRDRGRKAGAAAVASPRHVSKKVRASR